MKTHNAKTRNAPRLVAAALVLIVSRFAGANDGALDPAFGNFLAGRSRIAFPSAPGFDFATGAAVQADGKIVLAGLLNNVQSASPPGAGVARLNADGSIDSGFGSGSGGAVVIAGASNAWDVALQPDGKIVVAGASGGANADFLIARFAADGSLDTSFNRSGLATVAFDLGGDNRDVAESIVIDSDGRLLVAGRVARGGFAADVALARLNADGSLDDTFGLHGRDVIDAFDGGANPTAYDNVVMHRGSDGKLILSASAAATASTTSVAMRLNADGSVDFGYGQSGLASLLSMYPIHSTLQPDGKLVIAGGRNGANTDFAIARLLQSGAPDSSFGGGSGDLGITYVAFDLGGNDYDLATGVAIESDGNVVVAGFSTTPPQCSANAGAAMNVVRLLPNGQVDASFGSGSPSARQIDFNIGGDCTDIAYDVVLQNGRPVLVGGAETDAAAGATGSSVFAAARLTSDTVFRAGFE
jgi:uncharacterized delta-60 repeat protein